MVASSGLTMFGAAAVTTMLVFYWLEPRSSWFTLCFAAGCAASSAYGWMSGTWPFGVVEGVWAVVALLRWRHQHQASPGEGGEEGHARG